MFFTSKCEALPQMPPQTAEHTIRAADPSEIDALAAGMTKAFSDDPYMRWLLEDAPPDTVEMYFKAQLLWGFDSGLVETTDKTEGCAIWLPDDSEPPAKIAARLMIFSFACRRFNFRPVYVSPVPDVAEYSILQFVAAFNTNRGIGTALLNHGAQILDTNGRPAYLEASTPDSERLYAKLGYRAIGKVHLKDGGPKKIPMWREPQFVT